MDHIKGIDRDQLTLFPESLDKYVSQENPVRFIDAFVESLDFEELGFSHATPAETGRPPYDPADLLRLYVYGYLNRVRSSRRLERKANRNTELMWLLRRLAPDFKTIADFRKDNARAIREVCKEFIFYCRKLRLFGGELIAIDGSRFKAVNARDRNLVCRRQASPLASSRTRARRSKSGSSSTWKSWRRTTRRRLTSPGPAPKSSRKRSRSSGSASESCEPWANRWPSPVRPKSP